MGTESIGRCPIRHGRDNRLPNRGISEVNKLLVFSRFENNVVSQQEIRDVGYGEQLPHTHATHHQGLEPIGFR